MKYAIVLLFLALGLAAVSATSAQGQPKVTICHAGSELNPNYVEVSVSQAAWDSGHSPHSRHELDYLGPCNGFISVPGTVVKPTPTPGPLQCWIPEGCPTGTIEHNMTEIRSTGLIEHDVTEVRSTASSIIAPPSDEPGRVTAFPNSGGAP